MVDKQEERPEKALRGVAGNTAEAVARVAAAFAARETSTIDQIVNLTERLIEVFTGHGSLDGTAREAIGTVSPLPEAAISRPAIPIDRAVSDEKVYCLCCGRGFTMLKRHLKAEHHLTEEEYRSLYALPDDVPLVAPNYSARKAAYAKRIGLGKYDREQGIAAG